MADTFNSAYTGSTIEKAPVRIALDPDTAEANVLHQYASFNYLWTLSGLSEEEIRDPKLYKTKPAHDIIARSGGIGTGGQYNDASPFDTPKDITGDGVGMEAVYAKERNQNRIQTAEASNLILKRGHDIFFKKAVITGSYTPNPDRKLMNFNKIELELHEPLGVTLFEKLRAAAYNNGYIDHTDAPYLLTLEFVGMDSRGKVIRNPVPKKYYPIKINNFEINVNAGGTIYTGTAIPWTELGMANRFLYTRGQFKIEGSTLREKFDSIEKGLHSNQEKEIAKKIKQKIDTYTISLDPWFTTKVEGTNAEAGGTTSMNDQDFGSEGKTTTQSDGQVPPGTAISKLIEQQILRTPFFSDISKNYVEKYYGQQESDEYVPWFKIITTVHTEKEFDAVTKMHKKKIIYHVKPYRIHVLNFSVPGLSGADLYGKRVKKHYNYIYTGQNLDILDLDINYKAAFFQSTLTSGSRAMTGNDAQDTNAGDQANQFYGQAVYPEPTLPLRSYPGISSSEDANSKDGSGVANRTQEFFDYIVNGTGFMVRVEMKIMGDPAFIGDHFAEPIKILGDGKIQKVERVGTQQGRIWDDQTNTFNFDEGEPLVTLNFRYPTDFDEVSGNYKFKSQEEVQFNGLYKVSRVESYFDSGQFTQMLTMIRMNNQKGAKQDTRPVINKEEINYNDAQPKATDLVGDMDE